MNTHWLVLLVGLVWVVGMLRLLPKAWRLDQFCPNGERRKPKALPPLRIDPLTLRPLLNLCL